MNRNDPCPCGSGIKLKKCCGANVIPGLKPKPKPRAVAFSCVGTCADQCCGGATMITVDEVASLFDVFPVTVGFRKYHPADEDHSLFLEAAGIRIGRHYIIGDFIAGNWRSSRCRCLDHDNDCLLHDEDRKPAQCSLVPFGALYPEALQDIVIASQRARAFERCRGFDAAHSENDMIWRAGRFADQACRDAFNRYRSGLLKQQPLMSAIFRKLQQSPDFGAFMNGEGIFETALPQHLFERFCELAGLGDGLKESFLTAQRKLCMEELRRTPDAGVFRDMLSVLDAIGGKSGMCKD